MKLTDYIYHPNHADRDDFINYIKKPNFKLNSIILPKTNSITIHDSIQKNILNLHNYSKENYVAQLSNCSILSHNQSGSISLLKNKIRFKDFDTPYDFSRSIYKNTYLKGFSVLLSSDSFSNYFHWLCQALPRIQLLNDYKINWNHISNIIYPEPKGSFVKETLKMLNVPLDLLLPQRENIEYSFDKLLIPSLPNKHIYFSKWSLDFIKSLFIKKNQTQGRKLYIIRDYLSGRQVLNDGEVWNLLESQGYEKHYLSGMSVLDQALLFNSASEIISPHGADLANLSFCQPQTRVIELFNSSYFNPVYWSLSNYLNLSYSYMIGSGLVLKGDKSKRQSIIVDVNNLEKLII